MAKQVLGSKEDWLALKVLKPTRVELRSIDKFAFILPPSYNEREEIQRLAEEADAGDMQSVIVRAVANRLVTEDGDRCFSDEDFEALLDVVGMDAIQEIYSIIMNPSSLAAAKADAAKERMGNSRR